MEELWTELKKYYFDPSDPKLNGFHPRCIEIWDQMKEILSDMDENELVAYLEGLPEEDLEIIYPVVEDLAEEDRDYVEKFIR